MATFEETVLGIGAGPLVFARCKELIPSATIADYSGHDNPLEVLSDNLIFGQASGVETDASARTIYTPSDFANFIGQIASPPSELLFTGNFTIACFVKEEAIIGPHYLAARGGSAFSNSNGIHLNTAGSGSVRNLRGVVVTTSGAETVIADIDHLSETHNFHVFTRNGSVLRLYTNGVLTGETTGASTDPILSFGTPAIKFGSAGNNLGPLSGWGGEFIICDFAWTEAEQLAVYESAINSIFLRGRADAGPTGILRSEFESDPIEFPWRHNWVEPLVERISFRSAVSSSVNGVEEGVSQRISPRRELEFNQLIRGNVERRKLRAQLWANQHAKWFVPVRQYAEQLLEPVSVAATTTPITTALKDYEAGLWIGLRQYAADGSVEHSEVRQITSLSPLVHEALENSYVAYRSIVYPVRRALIPSAISLRGHTDAVEEVTLTFRLLPEDEALVPNRIATFSPSIKYRDVEVFDGQLWQSNDWSEQREYEIERAGAAIDFDNGLLGFESDTIGASETFSYRMTLSGHASIAAFLGWFYERRGQLAYLWVPSMQEDFEILSTGLTTITVRDTNYSDSYALAEPRRDLAFIYFDGSMEFRRVTGFSGTVNETLTLDAAVPTLTNLRLVSLLKYCRMDADQLELAWHTDTTVQVAWRFREVLHTPEGTGLSSLSPSSSLSSSQSPSASVSPSASSSPSLSPSLSPSPSASVSPSASISPSASASPSGSISATPSLSPSPSSSVSSSPSESPSPSSSVSLSPSPSASASPSV